MEAALDFETLIEMLVDDVGYYLVQLTDPCYVQDVDRYRRQD